MASVKEFLTYLALSNKNNSTEALSLANFFKQNINSKVTLELNHIELFLDYSMNFNHWVTNKQSLITYINSALNSYSNSTRFVYSANQLNKILTSQYIKIHSLEDLKGIILKNNQSKFTNSKTHFICKSNLFLSILWTNNTQVTVREHSPMVKIKNFELSPIPTRTVLQYDQNMNLFNGKQQSLSLNINTTVFFTKHVNKNWDLKVCKGYSYSSEPIRIYQNLNQTGLLYLNLKKIESNYINPSSDDDYIEVCQLVETSVSKLRSGDYEAIDLANNALLKGKYFLNNVFPGDRMLTLLITNLEYTLKDQVKLISAQGNTTQWNQRI